MKQKCTLKVLLVALWSLSVSVKSYAEVYSGTCGESVNWSLDTETGLLEITGSGEMEDYNYYDDTPWYSHRSSINKCTIENGVTSIGGFAFRNCTRLTRITIPESVTSIGNYAFDNCTGLTSITIPNSVTSIGRGAFDGTSWLNNQSDGLIYIGKVCYGYKGEMPENTTIIIKEGTTSIGMDAFYGCTGLKSITIPESVTSIGERAFSGCTGLTSITIPESVTSIGGSAFYKCTGLTSITIPESVTSIGGLAFYGTPWLNNQSDGLIYIGKVCYGYKGKMPENTTIIIKEGTTSIGGSAFSDCTGLTSITIPNSVTSIGDQAFWGCTGLTSITIPESVTSIGGSAFYKCTGLTSITIGNSVTSIGYSAFSDCTGLTSITIPNSVTSIGDQAFWGCTGLTSITIPESVTSIGEYAFRNCTGLTSITWNAISCTSSSYSTFDGIEENITSFTFGDKVQTIPADICYCMSNLTNITIPESVTSIGYYAFYKCTGLTSITIPESVTSIGSSAFEYCSQLKTVINYSKLNITQGSSSYGYVAYYADKVIKPDTQIDDFFFEDRTDGNYLVYYIGNETELTLPENYQGGSYGIGDYAFCGCTGLTSITIPESVTSIGRGAFYKCTGLTSITIPNSVTSIGDSAFEGCTTLRIITLSENVKGIGHNAFSGCTKMRQIYCRSQEPPVCGSSALYGIDTWDCTLFVPEGAEALYKAADQWKEFFFIEEITGIDTPRADDCKDTTYDIYDMSGRTVRKAATTTDGLKPGLYIINGRKVLVE